VRIAMVGPELGTSVAPSGGVGSAVWALATYLRSAGHVVEVVDVRVGHGEPSCRNRESQLHVVRLSSAKSLVGRAARAVGAVVDHLEVDIVHVHGAPEVYRPRSIPTVFTIHGIAHLDLLHTREGLRRYTQATGRWATYFWSLRQYRYRIAISRYAREIVGSAPGTTWFNIPNPLSDAVFAVVRASAERKAVMVGRVGPLKNQHAVIRAVASAREPSSRLTLVGPVVEPYAESLQREASELGVELFLTGSVPHSSVLAEIASADVMLHLSQVENAPLSVLEAMAVGVPVIATDVAALPEILGNGRGRLVPDGDSDAAADALRAHDRDPALSSSMAIAARDWVCATASADVVGRATIQAYEHVAANWV